MQRNALGRAAAVGVLPRNGFRMDLVIDVAGAFVSLRPIPEVLFQVLLKSSSTGKGRLTLSVNKLTVVA